MGNFAMHHPNELTDVEWELVRSYLPPSAQRGAKRQTSMRAVLDAILYTTSRDRAWRKLPKSYPPWQTVYGYYRKWQRDGTWEKVQQALGST